MSNYPPVKRNVLLNPGPATTTDTVKYAQVVPDICPREKEFADVITEIRKELVKIVHGDPEVWDAVVYTGSGTLCEDVCVSSVVPDGKKICVLNNGAYGQRMCDQARYYHIPLVEIKAPKHTRPNLAELEKVLKEDKDIAVVAIVHHETTTGLLNDMRAIGKICHDNGVLLVADTVSSYAGIPIDVNKDNIDFLMGTSNKCIQGMAGAAWVIGRRSEIEKTKNYTTRSYYTNLYRQYEYFQRTGEMNFTPPVQVLYSLKQAIKEYWEEGEQGRWDRYTKSWKTIEDNVHKLGFKTKINPEDSGHLVVTVMYPDDPNFNFNEMHDYCYERGFTIYPGKIAGEGCFRLCCLGAIDYRDIEDFFVVFKEYLAQAGVKVPVVYKD